MKTCWRVSICELESENGEISEDGNKYSSRFAQTDLRTGRLYPQEITPGSHFCLRLSRPQGHSEAGRLKSTQNLNNPNGNRSRQLPDCRAVRQPIEPPRAPGSASRQTFQVRPTACTQHPLESLQPADSSAPYAEFSILRFWTPALSRSDAPENNAKGYEPCQQLLFRINNNKNTHTHTHTHEGQREEKTKRQFLWKCMEI